MTTTRIAPPAPSPALAAALGPLAAFRAAHPFPARTALPTITPEQFAGRAQTWDRDYLDAQAEPPAAVDASWRVFVPATGQGATNPLTEAKRWRPPTESQHAQAPGISHTRIEGHHTDHGRPAATACPCWGWWAGSKEVVALAGEDGETGVWTCAFAVVNLGRIGWTTGGTLPTRPTPTARSGASAIVHRAYRPNYEAGRSSVNPTDAAGFFVFPSTHPPRGKCHEDRA